MVATVRRSIYADKLLAFSDFVFSDGAQFRHRGAWGDFFGARIGASFSGRIVFEIGCNDAGLLARVAAKNPLVAFVGIDWKYRALHTAAERVASSDLRNVALLRGRAQDVRRIFADDEVDDMWLFHPEPCDKPRELSNRLLSRRFLLDVHPVLRDSGSLILKTDHAGYFEWSLAELDALKDCFDLTIRSRNFWSDSSAKAQAMSHEFAGESTAFEDRFRRRRKPIYYLQARRRAVMRILDRTSVNP